MRRVNRMIGAAALILLTVQAASPGAAAGQTAAVITPQESNQRSLESVRRLIAGHENEPAGQVFRNVQFLRATPAGTLLVIMNLGYAQALGVTCEHCHVPDDFASDAKRPKRAAREMQALHKMINDRLATLTEIRGEVKAINCNTCHRGSPNPQSPR